MSSSKVAVLLLAALACAAAAADEEAAAVAAAAVDHPADAGPAAADDAEVSLAHKQYLKAIAIRRARAQGREDDPRASYKEVKRAVSLLYAAAGIEHLSMGGPRGRNATGAGAAAALASAGIETAKAADGGGGRGRGPAAGPLEGLTAASVQLVLRNESDVHLGALKELVFVYREGDGAPFNAAIAHRLLQKLAELGDPEAQGDLAVHLAQGIEPLAPNPQQLLFALVQPDLAAALTHYAFAAAAGDPVGQMALGYRHLYGLGVPQSCQTAVLYYVPVAERVISQAQKRDSLPQTKGLRLRRGAGRARPAGAVLHYQWFADFGNVEAARMVAHMMSHGAQRDYEGAAAEAGDADAMAHLGHIYANGVAVRQDNTTAMGWFWKAAEAGEGKEGEGGHPSGFLGLGYVYMSGHGVARDYGKALKYFKEAVAAGPGGWSGQGDAYYYLGLMHLKGWGTKQDLGNLLASHSLAMLHLGGHTTAGEGHPCRAAVFLLKKVAEKGWPSLQEGNEDWAAGDHEWALLNYLKAAELGQELGQSNAAWMLTEGHGYEGPRAGQLALDMYKRAAEQGDKEALLRIGDGYWYGKGVDRDWRRAGQVGVGVGAAPPALNIPSPAPNAPAPPQLYVEAGNYRHAQALFNLGLMHQFGAGLPQDFPLAKRYYDQARDAGEDGRLAVALALAGLRAHAWWLAAAPRLPRRLAWLGGAVGALLSPNETAAGPGHPIHHHHQTLLGRVRSFLTLNRVFDLLDALFETSEGMDVTVIMGLGVILMLVLWRRQALRNQRQQQQAFLAQQPPPPPLRRPEDAPLEAAAQQQAAARAAGGGGEALAPGAAAAAAAAARQQPPPPPQQQAGQPPAG
eukprot:scaffold9.g3160.t1